MRFVLPLVALCALASAPLRADMFNITLSGTLSGDGTFSTDEICSTCTPGLGLLSLTINIGPDSGAAAFDISDDSLVTAIYLRAPNMLVYTGINSETGDFLDMAGSGWSLIRGGMVDFGTFSITQVPEPSSLFLFMPTVALFVGLCHRELRRFLQSRYQRHRP